MILETYKKTFWRMQAVMMGGALMIAVVSGSLSLAALFMVVMQVSSLIGASWATRLKHKVARDAGLSLPSS